MMRFSVATLDVRLVIEQSLCGGTCNQFSVSIDFNLRFCDCFEPREKNTFFLLGCLGYQKF